MVVLTPSPAGAVPACIVDALGIRVCGELLEPLPTITIKPDPIIIPGPTETTTIKPPPVTVTVPGPEAPQETVTVTPEPEVVTETPDAVPEETVTETTSPSPTGQPTDDGGTIAPDDNGESDFFSPDIDFGDGNPTVGEVGLGILTLLALVGLLLLSMYLGYILGYKDKERKDTDFLRALLDTVKSK